MPGWVELLPDGVQNPIVIEIQHPKALRGNKSDDAQARQQTIRLNKDDGFLQSRKDIAADYDADHVTVLLVPSDDVETKGPKDKNIFVNVHFPPTTQAEPSTAAAAVWGWFKGSAMGKIYVGQGNKYGMKGQEVSGSRYGSLSEIAGLKPSFDDDEYDHHGDDCACH